MILAIQTSKACQSAIKNLSSLKSCIYHLSVRPSGKTLTPQEVEIEYKKVAAKGKAKNKNTKNKIP